MAEKVRVLIADDHPVVRRSLVTVVNAAEDFAVVGEAGDGPDAIRLARELRPDLLILDLRMPGAGGLEVLGEIKGQPDGPRVLVLTAWADEGSLLAALRSGARGVLAKDSGLPQILDAMRAVSRGIYVIPEVVARQMSEAHGRSASSGASAEPLTPREVEVLRLVGRGMSNGEIAAHLSLSVHTAVSHVRTVLAKLGVENRTQAAVVARDRGLL